MSTEQTVTAPLVNASCDDILDTNPVVSAILATILGVLAVGVLISNVILACTALVVTGTQSVWLPKFRDLATAISGLIVSLQLTSGVFQTVMMRGDHFLQPPSVCAFVLSFQLFAVTVYHLVSAALAFLSVRTLNNPLRAEERSFKILSVVCIVLVWVFGLVYFGTQIGLILAHVDFTVNLCKKRACMWHIYPKDFLMTTIHGIIGPALFISGCLMLLLVRLAHKHARQIDAQQAAVRAIQIPDSVTTAVSHSSSKKRKINMCLLMYLPWVVMWNLVPSLMLLNTHCPMCLSPQWSSFVWLAPFGSAVFGSTVKLLSREKLRVLCTKLRTVYCQWE